MEKILRFFIKTISAVIGKKRFEKLLIYSAKTIDVNLYLHGLIQVGALNSFDSRINGEELFIRDVLSKLVRTKAAPIFFDVGANIGDFSLELRNFFPGAEIHSFEPVNNTFNILTGNAEGLNLKLHNIGFSDKTGTGRLFNTVGEANNTIASAYKDVFQEIFKMQDELNTV